MSALLFLPRRRRRRLSEAPLSIQPPAQPFVHLSIIDLLFIGFEVGVDNHIKTAWSQGSFSSRLDLLTTPPSSLLFLGAFANRVAVFS